MERQVMKPDDVQLIKNEIMKLTREYGCIKSTKIIVEVMKFVTEQFEVGAPDLVLILNECVRDKEIVELEYILEDMDYSVKTVYFPAGTTFNMKT